ncbi:hypothetical protein LX32DRAFT_329837 [Colletotrichum zoysiae]|uniref:Uncharacterized protein n=1 Tax=Colletotrichum zoysiae TaxID=1216348 RepID=A0AAD9LU22_9PEZI|nr:hypothetical protein LX32DRAFT_329837 [Colletotrichum zoysiae]
MRIWSHPSCPIELTTSHHLITATYYLPTYLGWPLPQPRKSMLPSSSPPHCLHSAAGRWSCSYLPTVLASLAFDTKHKSNQPYSPHALFCFSLFYVSVSLSFHTPTTYIVIIITSTHPSNIPNQGTNTRDTHTPAEKDLGHIPPAGQLSRPPYLPVCLPTT